MVRCRFGGGEFLCGGAVVDLGKDWYRGRGSDMFHTKYRFLHVIQKMDNFKMECKMHNLVTYRSSHLIPAVTMEEIAPTQE